LNSWTIFFMFKSFTTLYTTVLTKGNEYNEEFLIQLAKEKIIKEIGIDPYNLADILGKNDNFGKGWILVEDNLSATEEELKNINIKL
jgi:hypothetical protein